MGAEWTREPRPSTTGIPGDSWLVISWNRRTGVPVNGTPLNDLSFTTRSRPRTFLPGCIKVSGGLWVRTTLGGVKFTKRARFSYGKETMTHALLEPRSRVHQRRAETGTPRVQAPRLQSRSRGPVRQSPSSVMKRAAMSPKAGVVLLDQIAAKLRATIPHAVRTTGAEDAEELLQDATAMAARCCTPWRCGVRR